MSHTPKLFKRIISVDAFNTLFIAKRPVMSEYINISSKHGLKTTETQLSERFPSALKGLKQQYPNYGKGMGIDYKEWWSKLIRRVYQPEDIDQKIINEILEVFESKLGYMTYPDVIEFLKETSEREDVVLVTISNGEPRFAKTMESLDILKYFHKVYLSYDTELVKPNPEVFHHVFKDIQSQFPNHTFALDKSYHIGDEYVNDLEGSYNAGWNGILVDRTQSLEQLKKEISSKTEDEQNTLMKMVMTGANTITEGEHEIKKLGDRKYIANSFVKLPDLLYHTGNT